MKPKHFMFLMPLIIILIWLAYPFLIASGMAKILIPAGNWTTRGVIGDSFGALNTLFSGLALTGLGINIYMQNSQILLIEKKEQENTEHLLAQSDALRYTALLNYYNSEIERTQRLHFEGSEKQIEQETRDFLLSHLVKLQSEREEIITKLKII